MRAARALIPLYEADEKWSRLPALYELLLARTDSDDEQLELLGKLVTSPVGAFWTEGLHLPTPAAPSSFSPE